MAIKKSAASTVVILMERYKIHTAEFLFVFKHNCVFISPSLILSQIIDVHVAVHQIWDSYTKCNHAKMFW